MDDHVVDAVLGNVVEHRLELRSVSALGRGPAVHELLDDDCSERSRLALVSFALGRNGETFDFSASVGLVARRDTQVGDCRLRDETLRECVREGC